MTRKNGWEESTKAPDWIDVEMLMRAIGSVHSAEIAVVVSPSGTGSSGGVDVATSAIFTLLPGSSLPQSVVVHSPWPCKCHTSLAAHAFEGLHRLDFEIGETYKNEKLWK